jgi:hypothetical protein
MIRPDDVVISYWAIGPTYVRYLNKNLEDSLAKYPQFFKFTILTDDVDAFSHLLSEEKCLAIIDINEARKDYRWSFELEKIPSSKIDAEYTREFQQNLRGGVKFSYSLHRFALPWFIENGITNIYFLDPDVHLTMDWPLPKDDAQLYIDTYLITGTPPYLIEKDDLNYMIGQSAYPVHEKLHADYYRTLQTALGIEQEPPEYFFSTDGPCRFYHFENVESLKLFFKTWNDAVKVMLTEPVMRYQGHGGVFFNDEVLLPCIYHIVGIKLSTLSHTAATARHRIENRYFMPSFGNYKLTDTYEEFLIINKEELDTHHGSVHIFDFPKRGYDIS